MRADCRFVNQLPDPDPDEREEWTESIQNRVRLRGERRAKRVLHRVLGRAVNPGVSLEPVTASDYVDTIPGTDDPSYPGDEDIERRIGLHLTEMRRVPYVFHGEDTEGPIVAITDFVKDVRGQAARWVPQSFIPLGMDGFGLSDMRSALRSDFESDAVAEAVDRYGIDPLLVDPRDA